MECFPRIAIKKETNCQQSDPNEPQMQSYNPNQPHGQSQSENNMPSTSQNYRVHHANTNSQVLLSTALVSVKGSNGSYLTLRALIDTGSEASFITEAAVQRLNLRTRWTFSKISGLGEVSSGASNKIVDLRIASLTTSFAGRMQALVLKSLTGLLPTRYTNTENLSYLDGLQLADPTFNIPAKVDMLLGSDIYGEIILGEVVRNSGCSGTIAQRTQLGWIVLGKVVSTEPTTIRTFFNQVDLNTTMKRFWEIEEEPFEKYESEEDRKCEEHFKKYTKRLPDGRYQVRLPFKGGEYPSMGPTQQGAVRRFLQLEKRLQANPTQHEEYAKCMSEYLELGHMTPVEESNEVLKSTFHCFIPHHAVIKESSTTTRLRVVFDATFKPFFGSSLNDKLMVGPKVQTNVIDIILRWRKYRFTFTGDVEKMYRQIRVNTADTNYQLILWRENPTQNLQIYRLETVTFGTASAPYLAIRVFLQLADDEASNFPLATNVIREETYVDDVISGADTIEETQLKLKAVRELLATAGFHLRKQVSNSEEVLKYIPPGERAVDFSVPFVETSDIKTLGIKWLPVPDVFSFQVAPIDDGEVTKRSILSAIAKLYDPMGWISPCIIKAKIMMQQLWGRGLDWDKPIPTELEHQWLAFRQDLPAIERIQIHRWISTDKNISKLEVHGFSDASEKAYAAAVYVRVLGGDGVIHMHLLMSKTKVAPLETITLPRLELCGAVLLAKLLHETTKILKLEAANVYAWTDSVITLCWIRAPPSKWKTFICNRVSQIQKFANNTTWKHIPSELNPADVASRGIFPSMLVDNQLWWEGPDFLRHQWDAVHPNQPSCLETHQEARSTVVHHCIESKIVSVVNNILQNCSTLTKTVRVVAYCLRMQMKTRPFQQYTDVLSPQELERALMRIIRSVQEETFASEDERTIARGYQALAPFKDGEGILRVGGRLLNSTLPFNKKHPILLKADNLLSKRIISDAHEKTLHGGNEKMIAYIRQRFWIFNLKNAVKKEIHDCNICFKFRAKPLRQLMGNLPTARTTISRPFTYAGVDYAGPIDVKTWRGRNAKTLKVYFAVFVHIELVSDMTTQTFLSAFRRLVARRGLCRELFSDCGRNFVGGNRELLTQLKEAQFSWKTVAEVLANEGTKWNFIPPASPNFGGLWEAGVKSVKFHLKRVAGNQILTYEELTTLLTQVEACLNSRPLCPQSEDINDLGVITPGHFLVGEPLVTPPQPEYSLEKSSHLERWKRVQALYQSFWKLWSNEYLARLQQRPKWTQIVNSRLEVGDLVLIKDERLPPLKWNLGRITKLHPGPDNLVRVVTLKTETTELKRPISKICSLPSNVLNT